MFTPIRAVFVGDGSLVVRCVEAFVQAGHTVVRVASADAEVLSWAREHGLSAEAAGEVPRFEGDDFEVLFSIGWLHRLPQPLLRRASRVALNFHDGPLPRHGGLNAPAWALLEGCRHHGITWHEITEALDGGRIAGELCFDLAPDETAFSLNTHCYEAGFQSFLTLMDLLARDALTLRAPSGSPRLHSRHQRPAALATLDWRRPAADLAGLVRALDFGPTPNPLACAKLWAEGRLMRVGSAGVEEAAPGIGVESIEPIEPIEAIEPTGTPATTPIAQLATRPTRAMAPAGTVLAAQGARLWLATGQGTLRLEGLQALDGGPLPAWSLGERLAPLPPERLLRLAQARPALARGELAWRKRLLAWAGEPVADLPHPRRARMHETGEGAEASEDQPCPFEIALDLPAQADPEAPHAWLAGVAAWLAAVSGEAQVVLAWRDDTLARACEGLAPHVACWWPVGLAVHRDLTADALRLSAQQALASARSDGPITADLWLRLGQPAPAAPALGLCLGPWPEGAGFDAPGLCLLGPGHGHRPEHLQTGPRDAACADEPVPAPWRLRVDGRLWLPEVAAEIAAQLGAWLARFARHAGPIARLSLLPPTDIARLAQMNDSARALPAHPGLWPALSRALQARPASIALEWEGGRLTAAELRGRALGLSAQLRASGMAPGEVVGICLPRGPSLLVAVLAVLAAGGAYLPLDPEYPAERLRFMCRDAGLRRVLGEPAAAALLELPDGALVSPEAAAPVVSSKLPDASPDAPPAEASRGPGDLAYLIYTSGSTGQPKGVEVTQGNVLNFFAGMDAVLALPADARWLAVTSLSFDISVLELLWTLARGVTVVLHGAQAQPLPAAPEPRQVVPATPTPTDSTPPTIPTIPTTQVPPAAPQFSLFYFASEDSAAPPALAERGSDALTQGEGRARGEDPYRLLLEGARFADRHGFAAVWTPERHFHGFGGPFPNPALAAAALAMVTERVQLRAGSCVLPLHHPLAVAEDWALVDRLSGGRVGVSFAAGWQPQDFALAPEAWTDRRARLLEGIAAVRRLWRGEALAWPGPEGEELRLRTRPRPVQAELPVWVTAAGNPQTFAEAGRAGCHLLTHLLGQSVDELARKLQVYRGAWQAAGHPGQGQVTLMLHTLVGEDEDAQREAARAPLKAYLRSAMDLIRRADWRFPTFGQADLAQAPPTEAETEALLEHAYARYAQTSALIGAPARCLDLVLHLARLGVDEIACLIDFGLPTEQVLAQLPALHRLMRLSQEALGAGAQAPARALSRPPGQGAARALSVAAALQRQRITHLQCTPSQVAILLADAAGRAALSQLSALLVGGEALPPAMARALRALVRGPVLNMYGPTEATVWCSCGPLPQAQADAPAGEEALVSLGRPLANTTLHLRNTWGQECPAFVPGELCIAGAGLARGYHARPALNALRFIDDPLRAGRRLYRTGDQVRRHPDGRLVFLGRLDDQVKIRGHRIELGEVEAALARQAGVQEAVVVACRDEAGQAWLQAFVTARRGSSPQPLVLARALARLLPDFMLPRSIALRESLPTTPNGKIDRRALLASRPLAADARRALAGDDRAAVPAQPLAGAERVLPRPGGPAGERALHQLEALVAEAWRTVLGRADIAREANFFDLGGHSLAVIQVQRRLREATGVDLAITDMFRLTTVAAQARHLAARRRPASLAPPGAAATAPMPQAQPAQTPQPPQPPQPPQVAPSTPLALGQVRAQARRALRAGVPG